MAAIETYRNAWQYSPLRHSEGVELGAMEGHQTDNSRSYITVISLEYPHRGYPHDFPPGHIARDYVRERTREEFLRSSIGSLASKGGGGNAGDAHLTDYSGPPSLQSHQIQAHHTPRGALMDECSQTSSASTASCRPRKSLILCVYLPNDIGLQYEFTNGQSITTGELLELVLEDDELQLPKQANHIFSLWMVSANLEVQLKKNEKPLSVRRRWPDLLKKYTNVDSDIAAWEEARIELRRNVFLNKKEDLNIREGKVLELLYSEAKRNILDGRYPCEQNDYEMLAGLQARIQWGPYDAHTHTLEHIRSRLSELLPRHAGGEGSLWSRITQQLRQGGKGGGPEQKVWEHYRAIPRNATTRQLIRRYLELCCSLPYYGAAMFQGQVERPVRGLTSWLTQADLPVVVAISCTGIYVIDPAQANILVGLRYQELSWDYARPSGPQRDSNPDCLPCLFLQFRVPGSQHRWSHILQIFSTQAVMMDALISSHVRDIRRQQSDEPDGNIITQYESTTEVEDNSVPLTTVTREDLPNACLANKLDRLAIATFNAQGECIHTSGSWAFSH